MTSPRRIVVAFGLVAITGMGLPALAAKQSPRVGSPESVLPPCYVPTGVDTTGWQVIRWRTSIHPSRAVTYRLPATYSQDSRVRFEHGGRAWIDGQRRFRSTGHAAGGSYTCLPGPTNPGCSECEDTLAGLPLRLVTSFELTDSLYHVAAVLDAGEFSATGWSEELHFTSPDSSDQRLFLAIIRTLRPDSSEFTLRPGTGIISGRVTNDQGAGLPRAAVILLGMRMGAYPDSDGVYTLRNAPKGTYVLRVLCPGFLPSESRVEVLEGHTVEINFKLSSEAQIHIKSY